MDQTPNLKLPYIFAAQSQKHITHNEAIRSLDALVQLAVLDRDLAAPPAAPADGDRYIVAAAATGAWSGHSGKIAAWQDGAWSLLDPKSGWLAWVADEGVLLVRSGSAWIAAAAGGGTASVNPTPLVGVNATADTVNRLSVASDATLFNHAGAGHQQKINKASAAATASVLYQTAFSGRAETGLAGDDNWHLKVSADGAIWREAILVDRATGAVSLPQTPRREVLSANRTYYVRTDGNDANTGMTNAAGGAFRTLQKAIDTVAALDLAIFNVTISVAAGTYTSGFTVSGPWVGAGDVTVVGSPSTPNSVSIAPSAGSCITVVNGGRLSVSGFRLVSAVGYAIAAQSNARVNVTGPLELGTCGAGHLLVSIYSQLFIESVALTITGGAPFHMLVLGYSSVREALATVTLAGTPVFSQAYLRCESSYCTLFSNTFTGAATGPRFAVVDNGIVNVFGAGASHLPGSAAGTISTQGQYL